MQVTCFIGIDVSKSWLDAAICFSQSPKIFILAKFVNSKKGFKSMLRWVTKKLGKSELDSCAFGFEHTGNYSYPLSLFLAKEGLNMYQLNPAELKFSMGIQRGKSDPEDAKRIATYVRKNHSGLDQSVPLSPELKALQLLFSQRKATVCDQTANTNRIAALNKMPDSEPLRLILEDLKQKKVENKARITFYENAIKQHIKQHPALKQNDALVQSVPGIGLVTSAYLLITTHNFTRFDCWRKYASYCGTAPFSHQSGSSIKGPKRVNHFANKTMKALLFTAASSIIKHDFEIKQFYESKIAQGKPRLWVINAVKNKILSRVFAVMRRKSAYKPVDQYQTWKAAA